MKKKQSTPLHFFTDTEIRLAQENPVAGFLFVTETAETFVKGFHVVQSAAPGFDLPPVMYLIRHLEESAKKALQEEGLPVDIEELQCLPEDSYSLQTWNAKLGLKHSAFLKKAIAVGDAASAAEEMFLLSCAAIGLALYKTIADGGRKKAAQRKGGKNPKKCEGIILAIKELLPQKKTFINIWNYFAETTNKDKPFEVDNYQIYFEEKKLWQRTDGDPDTEKGITARTFNKEYKTYLENNGE